MKRVKHSPFWRRNKAEPVVLFGMVFLLWCGTGCSRAPEDPAWFESSSTGAVLPADQLREKISRTDSLFDLREMKREFILFRGGEPRIILDELDRRSEEILAEQPPLGSPSPEADLVAFDYRKIGNGRYRADYLFRVNRAFPVDLGITLYGAPAPEHLDRLSPGRREAGKSSEAWSLQPVPPTTDWRAEDYRFLSQEFAAQAIPYNMMMVFYDPARSPGEYGVPVQLGWRRGITESRLLENIRRVDNLIDLYRLEGDCENRPAARKAFVQKSDELLAETPRRGKISEGLDLMAFDYRRIGENRYRVDYLFRVNRPVESDCLIILYGVVDDNHRDLLSEERKREGKKSEVWSFRPHPPTGAWPAGRCILVSTEIEAQPIPYNMQSILYDRDNRRQIGELVSLGWRADPGPPELEDK